MCGYMIPLAPILRKFYRKAPSVARQGHAKPLGWHIPTPKRLPAFYGPEIASCTPCKANWRYRSSRCDVEGNGGCAASTYARRD
jgi:hypothetical protein